MQSIISRSLSMLFLLMCLDVLGVTACKHVATTSSLAQIRNLFKSNDPDYRMAALERIRSEKIKGPEVAELLLAEYEKSRGLRGFVVSAYGKRIGIPSAVDLEIIKTLGFIHDEPAKEALKKIYQRARRSKPRFRVYVYKDRNYYSKMSYSLDALSQWHEPDVWEIMQEAYGNHSLHYGFREQAGTYLIEAEMTRLGIRDTQAKVEYLMKQMTGLGVGEKTDWVKGQTGVKTAGAIRNSAIWRVVYSLGDQAVPFLKAELQKTDGVQDASRIRALEMGIRMIENLKTMKNDNTRLIPR